jgi:hypothetical protein
VEVMFSFELQRSRQADRCYANVGVQFLDMDTLAGGPPHLCHFYGRFGSEASVDALDFEADVSNRAEILDRFISREVLPAASACSTSLGAIDFYYSGTLRIPLVAPRARSRLGLPG